MCVLGYIILCLIAIILSILGAALKSYWNIGYVEVKELKWIAIMCILLAIGGGIYIFAFNK